MVATETDNSTPKGQTTYLSPPKAYRQVPLVTPVCLNIL